MGPVCTECMTGKLRTVWASMLLLFICILEYLSSALGSINVEHHSASSTSSNIRFPVSKAGSTSVRNNQNGPHPHET